MSSLNIYGKFNSTKNTKNISDQSERSRSDLFVLETNAFFTAMILIIINIFHLSFATIVVIIITFLWEMNASISCLFVRQLALNDE